MSHNSGLPIGHKGAAVCPEDAQFLAEVAAESISRLPLGVSLVCMKRLITGLSFSSFN